MRDVHEEYDKRNIEVHNIGICDMKMPFCFVNKIETNTIAEVSAGVLLNKEKRGAHLSRIIEVLNERLYLKKLSLVDFENIVNDLSEKCESTGAYLELKFTMFTEKVTPISKLNTCEEVEIVLNMRVYRKSVMSIEITKYGMMVCPCSKQISEYGAHAQKCRVSVVFVDVNPLKFDVTEVIQIIEQQFSSEVYSLIKRNDEQFITESSYENAKFSEDLVRDCLLALAKTDTAAKVKVKVKNMESIHKHNVYAYGEI